MTEWSELLVVATVPGQEAPTFVCPDENIRIASAAHLDITTF